MLTRTCAKKFNRVKSRGDVGMTRPRSLMGWCFQRMSSSPLWKRAWGPWREMRAKLAVHVTKRMSMRRIKQRPSIIISNLKDQARISRKQWLLCSNPQRRVTGDSRVCKQALWGQKWKQMVVQIRQTKEVKRLSGWGRNCSSTEWFLDWNRCGWQKCRSTTGALTSIVTSTQQGREQ